MFKTMEHCSKSYDIGHFNSTSVLHYQHQWELKQKKTNDTEEPKFDKNNWVKTVENIVLHLKLIRGMRGVPLAYVVQHHIKVAHILPGYSAYLNLNKEVVARAPIVDSRLNLKLNQENLDKAYLHQCDTFKINNALVYQILSKMFMNKDAYVYVKQRKGMQDSQAVYFDIHKQFLDPDHVARQSTDAERKLQNSHYGGEKKRWDWDNYIALNKEQHTIMESLTVVHGHCPYIST